MTFIFYVVWWGKKVSFKLSSSGVVFMIGDIRWVTDRLGDLKIKTFGTF